MRRSDSSTLIVALKRFAGALDVSSKPSTARTPEIVWLSLCRRRSLKGTSEKPHANSHLARSEIQLFTRRESCELEVLVFSSEIAGSETRESPTDQEGSSDYDATMAQSPSVLGRPCAARNLSIFFRRPQMQVRLRDCGSISPKAGPNKKSNWNRGSSVLPQPQT
jgi:hypothetical protein